MILMCETMWNIMIVAILAGVEKSRRPPRQEIPHLLPNCSAVKQTRFCLWKSQQLEVARTLSILKLKSKNASKNIKNQSSNVLHVNLIPQPLHNDLQSLETFSSKPSIASPWTCWIHSISCWAMSNGTGPKTKIQCEVWGHSSQNMPKWAIQPSSCFREKPS